MKNLKLKSEQTVDALEELDRIIKKFPYMSDSEFFTNTILRDIAVSLSIIADWCIININKERTIDIGKDEEEVKKFYTDAINALKEKKNE